MSHPMRVRGLKSSQLSRNYGPGQSHPMRVRGLKYKYKATDGTEKLSHPMRVRGLKSFLKPLTRNVSAVAPHAGAWIEISIMTRKP